MRDDAARAFSGGYERLVMVGDDYDGAYFQDDKPLREQRSAVGHSVRAVYQFVGALDCYGGDDPSLLEALETIWETMVERRMYLTGGIGSAAQNEGFTKDYDLPNAEAYAETCAAIGLCLWGSRMALVTGEAKYYDVFERALYNNVLAGVSEDSTGYHYVNPLESLGRHKRKAWFDCACCPPNVARFLLSLERYLATSDDTSVSVHVAAGQVLRARPGGVAVEVEVESDYPWSGDVVVRVRAESPVRFALRVRQPGWASAGVCDGAELGADGYWRTDREWSSETELRLSWPMSVERILPHPKVTANQGRVAFMRGPLVYCLEERDLGAAAQRFVVGGDSPRVVSSEDPRSRVWLEVPGWLTQEGWEDAGLDASAVPKTRAVSLWRPYATWNNGGEPDGVGTMVVWAPAGPE